MKKLISFVLALVIAVTAVPSLLVTAEDAIPEETTADRLVRAIYDASVDEERMGFVNPTILLGYVKPGGNVVIFSGDLSQIKVKLEQKDKLILFAAH